MLRSVKDYTERKSVSSSSWTKGDILSYHLKIDYLSDHLMEKDKNEFQKGQSNTEENHKFV
jgi:hypothetical protein